MISTFGLAVFLVKYRAELIFIFPSFVMLFAYYMHLTLRRNTIVQRPEKLHRDYKLMLLVMFFLASIVLFFTIDFPPVEKLIQSKFSDINFVN